MGTTAPTVAVKLGDKDQAVVFDFDRLLAIEAATTKTIPALLGEFAGWCSLEIPKDADAGTVARINAQNVAAARRFNVTVAMRFVAACLGTTLEELVKRLPLGMLKPLWGQLLDGLVLAARQLNGLAPPEGTPESPPAAPAASGG